MPVMIDERTSAPALPGVQDPDRLEVLERTGLLEEEADPGLDRVARLAAALLRAPAAFVTLVGPHEQRAPGATDAHADPQAGPRRSLPMQDSICQYQVVTGESLIIGDAREDPLTQHKAGVLDGYVRAYAGIPLSTRSGQVLGSLCVTDRQVRTWSAQEIALLDDLAALVAQDLEHRVAVRRTDEVQALGRRLGREVPAMLDAVTSLVRLAEQQDEPALQRYAALTRRRSQTVGELAAALVETELPVPPSDSGALPLVDLGRAVQRAVASARDVTGTTALVLDLPGVALHVRCDPVGLERALVHLLVSALHHTVDGQPLHVALVPGPEQAELRLDGSGATVPAGELARVVARFAQHVSATPQGQAGPASMRVVAGEVRTRSGAVEGRSSSRGLAFRAGFELAGGRVIELP